MVVAAAVVVVDDDDDDDDGDGDDGWTVATFQVLRLICLLSRIVIKYQYLLVNADK